MESGQVNKEGEITLAFFPPPDCPMFWQSCTQEHCRDASEGAHTWTLGDEPLCSEDFWKIIIQHWLYDMCPRSLRWDTPSSRKKLPPSFSRAQTLSNFCGWFIYKKSLHRRLSLNFRVIIVHPLIITCDDIVQGCNTENIKKEKNRT